jgi:hypothetical protein
MSDYSDNEGNDFDSLLEESEVIEREFPLSKKENDHKEDNSLREQEEYQNFIEKIRNMRNEMKDYSEMNGINIGLSLNDDILSEFVLFLNDK